VGIFFRIHVFYITDMIIGNEFLLYCEIQGASLYGKMECLMDKIESQVLPAPPNLFASLRAGFDAIANQVGVILIPIAIDLLLWIGPHLQVKTLLNGYFNSLLSSSALDAIQSQDMVTTLVDAVRSVAAQFNLLSFLRTIPVGIPSLMASSQPLQIPNGSPVFIDITNPIVVMGIILGLVILGLISGSIYYLLVARVSLHITSDLRNIIHEWAWTSLQVISLAAAMILLFIIISIPSSCVISAIALIGIPLGQFGFFLYFGVLLWLAFPLLFSAHGIFVNHNNALESVKRSMALTRMTLPTTSIFFLSVLALSEGLNILWRVPAENSWLTLLGLAGHAFITSALLAASFIYYRDADHWSQETLKILKSKRETTI
jgi:hypothetical protein